MERAVMPDWIYVAIIAAVILVVLFMAANDDDQRHDIPDYPLD